MELALLELVGTPVRRRGEAAELSYPLYVAEKLTKFFSLNPSVPCDRSLVKDSRTFGSVEAAGEAASGGTRRAVRLRCRTVGWERRDFRHRSEEGQARRQDISNWSFT